MGSQRLQQGEALAHALGGTAFQGEHGVTVSFRAGARKHELSLHLHDEGPWSMSIRPELKLHPRFLLLMRRPKGADGLYSRTLGLLRRTGQADFDEGVFVTTSMSRATYRQLFASSEVRSAALALVGQGFRVEALESVIRVVAADASVPTAEAVRAAAEPFAVVIDALLQPMAALHEVQKRRDLGSYVWGAWAVSTPLWFAYWRPVELWPWAVFAVLSVVLVPVTSWVAAFWGRGTRGYRLSFKSDGWAWVFLSAAQSVPLASLLVFGGNGVGTPQQEVTLGVRAVGRMSVEVDSWRQSEQSLSFFVGGHALRFKAGQSFTITVGRGRWGFDYVLDGGADLVEASKLKSSRPVPPG